MNIRIGSNDFIGVDVPLLWGTRAVLQDKQGRISVIDLAGEEARIEILGDKPAPGVEFLPTSSGFEILHDGEPLYNYNADEKLLSSLGVGSLPDCQVLRNGVVVGTNRFMGNMVSGYGVGIAVDEKSISMGAPLPDKLARIKI
ncbi:hypothetical protein [Rhodocaloribacter sp.]